MKHIARKFKRHYSPEEFEKLQSENKMTFHSKGEGPVFIDPKKVKLAGITTTFGYFIQGITIIIDKKTFVLPDPEQILIYFSMAQTNYNHFKQLKDKLIPLLNPEEKCNDEVLHIYFNFYGVSCSIFLFLAMSLESTMNLIIDSHVKNTILSQSEIQVLYRTNFENKIKKVVPKIFKSNYFKVYTNDFHILSKLISLRNDIAHSKPENGITNYDVILNNVFNYNYDLAFETVAKYINFHKKDLITECDCGNDY